MNQTKLTDHKITTGTKELASQNLNCLSGCYYDCYYCYARRNAIRYNRKTKENWHVMDINWNVVNKGYRKRNYTLMFASTHDIIPQFKDQYNACLKVIEKVLKSGTKLLITTKPNEIAINDIYKKFKDYKDNIHFLFTITSWDNEQLKKFERKAPDFEERMRCLMNAYLYEIKTSVIIEPSLDPDPTGLIETIEAYVTGIILLGCMNYYCKDALFNQIGTIRRWYELFDSIKNLYFKDSVYNRLKIPENKRRKFEFD